MLGHFNYTCFRASVPKNKIIIQCPTSMTLRGRFSHELWLTVTPSQEDRWTEIVIYCTFVRPTTFIFKTTQWTELSDSSATSSAFELRNVWKGNISRAWNILPWMAHCWHCQQRNNCLQGWQPQWGPDGDSWLLFIIPLCSFLLFPFSQHPPTPGEVHGKPWKGCVHFRLYPENSRLYRSAEKLKRDVNR